MPPIYLLVFSFGKLAELGRRGEGEMGGGARGCFATNCYITILVMLLMLAPGLVIKCSATRHAVVRHARFGVSWFDDIY